MKIFTVGACPYLLTHLGRMHSAIIEYLVSLGHEVESAAWHLDTTWFLPDEDSFYKFEKNGKKLCKLFPFVSPSHPHATLQLYEITKKTNPELVISIGDYTDIAPIYAIKAIDSKMFKWLSVLAIDGFPVSDSFIDGIKTADMTAVTSKRAKEELRKFEVESSYIPFGPNHDSFYSLNSREDDSPFRVISLAKNSSSANVGAFVEASGIVKSLGENMEFYLHTNISSPGEYNLGSLIKRHNTEIKTPEEFISINDGISDEELNKRYNNADVFVDCSVRSSTSLCCLEAMSTGCIPLVPEIGAMGEAVPLTELYDPFIKSINYIGDNEEIYKIVDPQSLVEKLLTLKEIKKERKKDFKELSSIMIKSAFDFCEKKFVQNIGGLIKEIDSKSRTISVEVI